MNFLFTAEDSAPYIANQNRASFYKDGAKYWEGIEPTVQGMLGGFEEISEIDVGASKRFLSEFLEVRIRSLEWCPGWSARASISDHNHSSQWRKFTVSVDCRRPRMFCLRAYIIHRKSSVQLVGPGLWIAALESVE